MSLVVAPARPAKNRVQGIDSSLSDLKLRDGRNLKIEIGGAIQRTPTLTRTIAGSSSIKFDVYDSELALLDKAIATEKFDVELDGLWFRSLGASKRGKVFSFTLEDRDIAILREFKGPKSAFRDDVTRAEFIVFLLREALGPRVQIHCPQLHIKQPIETASQARQAKEDAKANRAAGLGDVKGLTVKGNKATPAQIEMGERVMRDAEHEHAPFSAIIAMVAACIVESELQNLAGGDGSSSGVLQVTAETAASVGVDPRNVEQVVSHFLHEGYTGQGGAIEHARKGLAPGESAQLCQGSAFGARYGTYVQEAREWVEAYLGGEDSGSIEVVEPYTFDVGKEEDYWEAAKRLTKEVNWRVFPVAGRWFLIDEIELSRGAVRLVIERAPGESSPRTPGVLDVDFDYNQNKPVTEVTVPAVAKQWSVPPGAVTTVEGYGPASIGFGDAPVKADSKSRKAGISSGRNAKTGEGRGRYLVETIEGPLRDNKDAPRLVTITARKPTAPLPEPAANRKTVSGASGGGAGKLGALEGSPEDIVNRVVDYAHSHGFPDVTRESVRAANAAHGPTLDGGISDHQGPPNVRWAADMSNGTETKEETHLAAAIANAFDIPWDGSGLVTHEAGGYRLQLIYRTMEDGNHFNHVHFGCAVA